MAECKPTAIDLFSGAGGLSLGLQRAGFEIVCAIDNDEHANSTYSRNLGEQVSAQDITSLRREHLDIEPAEIDLVAGGPPCPTFSRVGRTKIRSIEARDPETDERHELYEHFLRIVRQVDPPIILLENVPGMQSATNDRDQKVLTVIRDEMRDLGYEVSIQFPDAADFGVPQRRVRTIFLGNKLDQDNPELCRWTSHRPPESNEERKISFPSVSRKEHDSQTTLEPFGVGNDEQTRRPAFPSYEATTTWKEPWVTVAAAILDLPPLSPDGDIPPSEATEYLLEPFTYYQDWARNSTENHSLTNHHARGQNMDDLTLYKLLGEGVGWIIGDMDSSFQPYRKDVFPDNYRKQRATRPASTVLAHISKDGHQYIHPREARSLTVREAARLQSFPDDFVFPVSRTQAYRQVGNAVPPLLAQAIGTAIREKFL